MLNRGKRPVEAPGEYQEGYTEMALMLSSAGFEHIGVLGMMMEGWWPQK